MPGARCWPRISLTSTDQQCAVARRGDDFGARTIWPVARPLRCSGGDQQIVRWTLRIFRDDVADALIDMQTTDDTATDALDDFSDDTFRPALEVACR